MKTQNLRANFILLLAAAIWGLSFVTQRVASNYIGPFTFNGIRFALGSLSLLPLIIVGDRKEKTGGETRHMQESSVLPGVLAGSVIFIAAALQQIGLGQTSAGKAAFITGLYMVFVPIFGIFLKQKVKATSWLGIIVAVSGLYLLSVTDKFTVQKGDLYVLTGAFFWAAQILIIDRFANRVNGLKLSCLQFLTASILSTAVAIIFEEIALSSILKAAVPILYGGILSTGVAYTLQIYGQKHTPPSHAAICLSFEAVFGSLGGMIILKENLDARGYAGCMLMFAGMLLSQLQDIKKTQP